MQFINAVLNPLVPFIRYALIAGLISSIAFGIIGSFVVVKRMSYIAGAISHTALGGIGLALYLNTALEVTFITPFGGALLFALLAGLVISYTIARQKDRVDTVIGMIWAVGMSIGLVFIYKTPSYADPMSFLFGNILLISRSNLAAIAILNIFVSAVSIIFHNQLVAVSFDQEFAQTRGIRTGFFQVLLIMLISLTVILMIKIVGIVMVIALLTIPPAVAGLFANRMKNLITASIIICAAIMSSGLFFSYVMELPTGSVTVILAGTLYLISRIIRGLLKYGKGIR